MRVRDGEPTPRGGRVIPGPVATLVCVIIVVAALTISLWIGKKVGPKSVSETRPEVAITHDSLAPTYTYDGEVIRWYVFIDPDTSVQYLVNDRGGCYPRLDQYGNVIGVQTWYD